MIDVVNGLRPVKVATRGVKVAVIVIAAPVVSLVAVPIFAARALFHWGMHRAAYNQTLTNGSRAKFGRVEGQDYTRWDGKAVPSVSAEADRMHDLVGQYIHGQEDHSFNLLNRSHPSKDTLFKTADDKDWLGREASRRDQEELLNADLEMIRLFAKALIPLVGVIWVFRSTPRALRTCTLCGARSESHKIHWAWYDAISFHQSLSEKLSPATI